MRAASVFTHRRVSDTATALRELIAAARRAGVLLRFGARGLQTAAARMRGGELGRQLGDAPFEEDDFLERRAQERGGFRQGN